MQIIRNLLIISVMVIMSIISVQGNVAEASSKAYQITPDLFAYAKQGKLKNFPIYIGMTRANLVKVWGEPSTEQPTYVNYDPQPFVTKYSKSKACKACVFRTDVMMNYQDIVQSIDVPTYKITEQQLIKMFGKPLGIASTEGGDYLYEYKIGDYEVTFSKEDGTSSIYSMSISRSLESYNSQFAIKTFVNGERVLFLDHPVTFINGKIYIPVPEIIHQLGGEMNWTPSIIGNNIGVMLNNKDVEFVGNKSEALINGKKTVIGAKTLIVNKRFLLPLDDVARIFSIKYKWDSKNKSLFITSK
ncbi:stalk domain-containing protein [Brevibacillus ginsengisoli]|uniref:stalk domain-containing protein n=1 Tax=Brevibacillus ginsengisoli TaxID=363854 RepID=UPI003CF00F3A